MATGSFNPGSVRGSQSTVAAASTPGKARSRVSTRSKKALCWRGLGVLLLRETEDQGQQTMRIAAGIVTLEDAETLNHQRRAEEKDERQRDLGDHQRAARASLP
jgi:hypothetical protein